MMDPIISQVFDLVHVSLCTSLVVIDIKLNHLVFLSTSSDVPQIVFNL